MDFHYANAKFRQVQCSFVLLEQRGGGANRIKRKKSCMISQMEFESCSSLCIVLIKVCEGGLEVVLDVCVFVLSGRPHWKPLLVSWCCCWPASCFSSHAPAAEDETWRAVTLQFSKNIIYFLHSVFV